MRLFANILSAGILTIAFTMAFQFPGFLKLGGYDFYFLNDFYYFDYSNTLAVFLLLWFIASRSSFTKDEESSQTKPKEDTARKTDDMEFPTVFKKFQCRPFTSTYTSFHKFEVAKLNIHCITTANVHADFRTKLFSDKAYENIGKPDMFEVVDSIITKNSFGEPRIAEKIHKGIGELKIDEHIVIACGNVACWVCHLKKDDKEGRAVNLEDNDCNEELMGDDCEYYLASELTDYEWKVLMATHDWGHYGQG